MTEELRPVPEQGPKIIRIADIAHPEGVHQDQRVMSFEFGEDDVVPMEVVRKVFRLLYQGDLMPDLLDLSKLKPGRIVAFGKNITGENEIKSQEEMTEDEREAFRLMNKYLTHSEFAPVRTIQ